MGHIRIGGLRGGSGLDLEDIDILTYDDGLGDFEILMDSDGNVLLGDFA